MARFPADLLNIHLCQSPVDLAMKAAAAVAAEIRSLIARRNIAVGIFSSEPAQREFWDELVKSADLEWTRVIAFHLDEYLGLSEEAPQSARRLLLERLVMR
ncbi:MAG: glucosamine-6-phosphate deaminase, partial [Blastocatellia bacterium]|nr:glucosamine-6-phosphate deaminase [Blastocatellia bacterium]